MIPGYQILHLIHTSSRTQVYRAIDLTQHRPVIIKLADDTVPIFDRVLQFRHQYTISHQIHHPQIVETYRLAPYQHSYALVLEDYGGMSLREWLDLSSPSIESKLQIAIDLTLALQALAQHQIIHQDINPSNILIHPVTHQVKLTDFRIAAHLPQELLEIRNPHGWEGTLAYLAPEQTGRMNRGIDYRCDFYSLGITLYELFTGELPFQAEDAISWIHCHLTQIAVSADLVNPEVPIVVAQIIAKLMAKNAEDRYQTAIGLKSDLDECLVQWQEQGAVTGLTIGQRDLSDKFRIPDRLYGRELAVQELLDAYARVAQGRSELILVAGCSGIGKTAVINQVHQPITRQQGYLITGKFDQFNRDLPLAAVVQAVRDLIAQLLSATDLQLSAWKNDLAAALGNNGQVLIDVIPQLEQIIGKQAPVPPLTGTAAQNRFNRLFQKFVEVFTTPAHPLVLCLDDLQWADPASLQTIELLMKGNGYLLILGAYRNREVSSDHPLLSMVARLQQAEKVVQTITLKPLTSNDIDRLVADTLHCSTDSAKPLTELIALKTQGNPFFITQFLQALSTDGAIRFTRRTAAADLSLGSNLGWEWDLERVQALALTDDVVEFMVVQLQRLPPATQNLLKLAACIGNSFSLDPLAIVSEQFPDDTAIALQSGLQAGLILPARSTDSRSYRFQYGSVSAKSLILPSPPTPLPSLGEGSRSQRRGQDAKRPGEGEGFLQAKEVCGNRIFYKSLSEPYCYRFLHDRVQQAAYSLIPADQQQQTHLQIGRLLLAHFPIGQQSAQLFEIVNHFNIAIDLIQTQSERELIAQLNLQAAQAARAATAYTAAFNYAQIGTQLLGKSAWQQQYQLTLALYENLAEAAFLSGNFAALPALVQQVLDRAQTPIDRVKTYGTIVEFHTIHKQYPQAIDRGLEILQQLGLKLAVKPSKSRLARELVKTKIALLGKSNEQLLNLPEMTSPEQIAKLRILELLQDPAFFCAQELMVLVALVGIQLTTRYGNTPWAASFYATYAIVRSSLGELNQIDRIGQLAMMLADRFADLAILAQVHLVVPWFCQPWREPLRASIPVLDRSVSLAIESGNLSYIGTNAGMSIAARFYAGFPLDRVMGKMQELETAMRQSQNENSQQFLDLLRQTLLNLQQPSSKPAQIIGVGGNGISLVSQWQAKNEASILASLYSFQTYLAYLFEDIPTALRDADAQLPYEYSLRGGYSITTMWLFDALTRLAAYPQAEHHVKTQLIDRVNYIQSQLLQRARLMPANFQHKYDLVAAEKCRVLGQFSQAIELYDRSICGATTSEYLQEAALAHELAAKFYLGWGKPKIAAVYLTDAYNCYDRWGATAKTADLKQRYPILLGISPHLTAGEGLRDPQPLDKFDIAAAIESAQSLSSIIELPTLIDRLCAILLKNSGSDTCIPILQSHNNRDLWQSYQIEQIDRDLTIICTPLAECSNLPLQLIERVRQSGEKIIFDLHPVDPAQLSDDYLRKYQPQSAMCLPLHHRGELQGIIYLENRHTANIFTPNRQIGLELIAAQAVISLHNAQLAESLVQRSARIDAAEVALRESEARYQKLADNIPGVIYQFRLAPDGSKTFPYISSGCWDLFQLEPTAVMLDPTCLLQMAHPEDQAALQHGIAKSAKNMTSRSTESRVILSSGEIKWIKAVSRPERQSDGAMIWDGVMLDITEQQSARQERNRIAADLVASQQKYYNLIQSVNGVVWEYDLKSDIFTFVSDRAVSLFGYPIEDWLSQPDFWQTHIYPEDLEPTLRTYNEAIEYRYDCEFEYRMVTADDRVIWVYDVSTLIRDPDGTPIATSGLFVDISDLKQVETDLQHTNEKLTSTNQELQRATRLKDEFLATMSHELRTPLNAVLGMSQALQEQAFGEMNPPQLKSLSTIERNGRHLLSLINDLLDISKIAAGKLELAITDISLSELCESSLISIEQQALNKQIEINTDIPMDLDRISVDERRMRQVLINLLNNAVKFTPEGGTIKLSVRLEPAPASDNSDLYFAITDTGIGIESDDLAKLFQPFVQIDSTLNRKYEGTGLGLSIVKQIVELHGGMVSIDSKVGTGSCFTVKIPQIIKTSHPPQSPLILLAEANENISSFDSYLTAKGYRTIFAQTGSEVISQLEDDAIDRPDLILIDLHTPDIDGYTTIAHIRQQPELAQIPIIALTDLSPEASSAKYLAIGATKCLEKPVKLRELNQTIQECLGLGV